MKVYDIRLVRGGRASLVFSICCADDRRALEEILRLAVDQLYDHYEVWRDMELIAHGPRLTLN